MKYKLLFFALIFITTLKAQTALHKRTWDYTQKTIHFIDSSASSVRKQKQSFSRQVSKIKSFSEDNKTIRVKKRTKIRKGNIYVKEIYKIGSDCIIKTFLVNGQPVLIKSTLIKKGYGEEVENVFTSLGGNKWTWTHLTYRSGIKTSKQETIVNLEQ